MYENEKCMPHGLPKEWKPCTKPSTTTASNPWQPPANQFQTPLCPLRGLYSLHLNKSKRGEYNRGLALQVYLLYKINGSACRSLPIKHIIKGFPRNITKHTKRRKPGHSTNPCGKPTFSLSPLRGTVGVNTNLFRFPLPLEGAGGEHNQKLSLCERLQIPFPCIPVTLEFAQDRAKKCRCK